VSVIQVPGSERAIDPRLTELHRRQAEHPFWKSNLLAGFEQGAFSKEDLQYIFSQYHLYSKSFTRFVAAVMANCENDLFRAQLSENLWDEGGGCEPDRRHAQIYRNFLTRALGVADPNAIEYAAYTHNFVREFLVACLRAEPMAGAAFLSLGTEGIVPRMYQLMVKGLRAADIPDDALEFFHIHISCDDDHAQTLEDMMLSYSDHPNWFEACSRALDHALTLRADFFASIFDALQIRRLSPILARMQGPRSLAQGMPDSALFHRPGGATSALYANKVDKLNVDFTVERLPFSAEVLDPRTVRIPPGKFNEKHKHAHETLIHILAGTGQVLVDDRVLPVQPGDTVLVPRWALHQTQNLGTTEMQFLAVTDFNLTSRAYLGNATDYRMHEDADAKRRN
jgi:pyrroloquinoline quinone (PQQ) biosynthesis protein C/quercetin dioxygenase-like cupin family protein